MFPFGFNSSYKVRSLFDSNSAAINEKLNHGNCTIDELLNEDEIIHELRMKNSKLISFFNIERVKQLIDYITILPSIDDETKGHRYPFYSCELLCSDENKLNDFFIMTKEELKEKTENSFITMMNNTELSETTISLTQNDDNDNHKATIDIIDDDPTLVINSTANGPSINNTNCSIQQEIINESSSNRLEILDYLLKFLDNDKELNHVLTGYFCKLLLHLLHKYPTKITDYLYTEQSSSFDKIIQHADYKSISEILLKLLSLDHLNTSPDNSTFQIQVKYNTILLTRNNFLKKMFCQISLSNSNFDLDNLISLCIDLIHQSKDILLEFISNEGILTHMFNLLRTKIASNTPEIVKHNYSIIITFLIQLIKNIQSNKIALPTIDNTQEIIIKGSLLSSINPDEINYTPLSRFILNSLRGILMNFNDMNHVKEFPSQLGYDNKAYKSLGLICLRIIELVKQLFYYFKEIPQCLDEILLREHFFSRAIEYFFKYEWNNIYQQNFINIFKLYIDEERRHQLITKHLFTEMNFANVLMERFIKDKAVFKHNSTMINPGYYSHIIYLCYKIYAFAGGKDMSNRSRVGSFNFVAISTKPFDLQMTSLEASAIIPHQQSPLKNTYETCTEIKNSLRTDWFETFDAYVQPIVKRYEMKLCDILALTQDNDQENKENDSIGAMDQHHQQQYIMVNNSSDNAIEEGIKNDFNTNTSVESSDRDCHAKGGDGDQMEITDLFDEEVEQSFDPKPVNSSEMNEQSNVIVDELDSKNYTEGFYWKSGTYDDKVINDALSDLNIH